MLFALWCIFPTTGNATELQLNEVWQERNVCVGPVWDDKTGVFKRFIACWASDHDNMYEPTWTHIQGVKSSREGKKVCFETTGSKITFRSTLPPLAKTRANIYLSEKERKYSVRVTRPIKNCF